MYAGSSPLRVAANPSHHIAHPTTESASLLRFWNILATLLASTAPHPIAVIPILGAGEIGLEGANWTDSGNLACRNADAGREDRNLELFGTEVPKDEITAIRSKLDRRANNTSSI